MASRSRLAAAEDMGKIIKAIRFSPRRTTSVSQHSRDPGFDRVSQFTQAPFKEMIRALDQNQLLRLGKRAHNSLELCPRTKLIAVAADEQLGFRAAVQKVEIIHSLVDRADRQTEPYDSADASIRTRYPQSHRCPK